MREIPKKNYFILAFVIIATICLVVYLGNWYKMSEITSAEMNLLSDNLPELRLEEIDTFLRENPNIIIYVASGIDQKNKIFEKKLYNYIIKNDLTNDFVYLNKDNINEKDIIELQKKYGVDDIKSINMTFIPNFYVVQDGKITRFYNKEGKISYQEAIKFLKEVGAI